MTQRLQGQNCKFFKIDSFVSQFLKETRTQRKPKQIQKHDQKALSHVRILIYRTWAFVEYKAKRVCLHYLIGLSLLLVSLHCSKKFSSRYPGFSPSSKSSVSKLKIRPGMVDKGTLCGYATSDSLFIMFLNDA